MSAPFMTSSAASQLFAPGGKEPKQFGRRYNGRYHMPLLPGEQGVKSGKGNWVPYGIQSTTELVSAFAESRALNIWEQEQMLYGLYRQPSLFEKACLLFAQWERDGVDFANLKEHPEVRKLLTGGGNRELAEESICGRAKQAAGANEAREAGTNRHTAWEHYCATGEIIGTPDMQEQVLAIVRLLEKYRLEIIPELSERVIRCLPVKAAGRFDNILIDRTNERLVMADLKTKKKKFWTWMEVDGQLSVYSRAEYILAWDAPLGHDSEHVLKTVPSYIDGPLRYVDQDEGVVFVAPSNGNPPYLRRADLNRGWRIAQLAREVVEERSHGRSAEREVNAMWSLPNGTH